MENDREPGPQVFKRIAIFGVGLIGGSFALALKKAGAVQQVVGVGRSLASLQRAQQLGIIDQIAGSVEDAVRGSDGQALRMGRDVVTDLDFIERSFSHSR